MFIDRGSIFLLLRSQERDSHWMIHATLVPLLRTEPDENYVRWPINISLLTE
jgi:hypothetical protein